MTRTLAGVGFLGLSGYEPRAEVLARAENYFTQRGARVVQLPGQDAKTQRFAATIEARLDALTAMLDDSSIKLILGLRGGYGLSQLLPRIDFHRVARAITERGVQFCGYSDFTAFNLGLLAATGEPSWTGPSAVAFGAEQFDPFTEERFWQAMEDRLQPLEFASEGDNTLASGLLWGGNLTMLVSLLGTPYLPIVKGGILFVEEVNEHPYRIERMLLQLLYAGILNDQRALIIGQLTNYRLSEYDAGYDVPEVIRELRKRLHCPVITGLPFGHVDHIATLPIGKQASVEVNQGHVRLSFIERAALLRPAKT